MVEHFFAAVGLAVIAQAAFREIRWRITRDPSGNSGRFKHWSEDV